MNIGILLHLKANLSQQCGRYQSEEIFESKDFICNSGRNGATGKSRSGDQKIKVFRRISCHHAQPEVHQSQNKAKRIKAALPDPLALSFYFP